MSQEENAIGKLVDQAVESTTVKRVILHSRCGCTSNREIAASELPDFIQVSLMVPEGWPVETRRFKYVGDSQVDGTPIYMEQIDAPPVGFKLEDGKLVPVETTNEEVEDIE